MEKTSTKITNKREIHGNIQYKTGLNIDILPFYTKSCCCGGGMYFVETNEISNFLYMGVNLRKVSIDSDARVYI